MKFETPLIPGRLVKRYKRFLADVLLQDGTIVTAHCTNSGSMLSCLADDAPVMLSQSNDPKRKTKFTWEMILIDNNWVGVNTMHPNRIVYEAVVDGVVAGLTGYATVLREVKVDDSRLDIVAHNNEESLFIEVKNVTLKDGRYARFPDAVTTRGQKHLHTLMRMKSEGHRAAMVYVIQRQDVEMFAPAHLIDPVYAQTLKEAHKAGVEIFPLQCSVSPQGIEIFRVLPFNLDD